MPPKREHTPEQSDYKPSVSGTPKKARSSPIKEKKAWTSAEEHKFREGINNIVKKNLWNELKNDPDLALRGANGVSQHWIAMYKKMQVQNRDSA